MCCNGTLFARLRLTPVERGRLGDKPDYFLRDGALRMRLPCAHLGENGACQVYDTRPDSCRDYKCGLLKRVENGDVPDADARGYVREAKRLALRAQQATQKALGEDVEDQCTTSAIPGLRARLKAEAGSLDQYLAQEAGFHLDAYVTYISLHFRPGFLT